MATDIEGSDEDAAGAGASALAGYEYQIDVSVWLALDLILASKLTHELVLEPPSEEDVEGELEEFEPGRVTCSVPLNEYRLIVQAKRRTGNAWTVPGINALLNHGKVRESAAKRLANSTVRYLLVTSAALNGGTQRLRVRRAGVWPKATGMPASIVKAVGAGAAGRVAIIGSQDEERLASDIKTLLTESFRVPNARWDECRRTLREEARIRISRGGSGRWTRTELERVIRLHDGYIASSPELEHYVHPTNWADLRSMMSSRHAALIIGQSGTGKTMATKQLYEELRESIPGLARVAISLGPHQIRDDQTERPVLYDIEDPWGRFDFDPESRPWNDQLAQVFAHASHDRMIVATSRLDVAQSAGALDSVKPWIIALEAEHYGALERRQLYRTRIDALPRNLQIVAMQGENKVLAELGTPLEIQKFFDALPTLDPAGLGNPPGFIGEAIRRAHQNSIERTVIDQIEERDDVRAAAVLWGLLKVNDKLSLRVLRVLEEGLAERESTLDEGVLPLVLFFVAARNLRQTDSTVTYYHPRVESGIEQALARHPLVTRRTLSLLVDLLLSLEGPGDERWGASAATRLIAAAARRPEFKPTTSSAAQMKIDHWLGNQLAQGGKDFKADLLLAAAAGSAASGVSEAARFLLHRPDPSFPGMMRWGPPEHDALWYARLRADPAVKPLIETFIRDRLPDERDDYRANFVAEAERLAPDLSEVFVAAAAKAVHFGVTQTSDAIAEGALRNVDQFEPIVDAALAVLTPSASELREAEETHLAIVNGEYSEDYAEHLAHDDGGYTANEFLSAYIDRVRMTRGWPSLAEHRHRDRLLSFWLRALAGDAAPNSDEVAGAFAASYGGSNEVHLWPVLGKAWDSAYLPPLEQRVLDGHTLPETRIAALVCFAQHTPARLSIIGQTLIARGDQARLIEIAIELGDLRHRRVQIDDDRFADAMQAASAALPRPYAGISEAAFALGTKEPPVLSHEACELIGRISGGSEELRSFRVALDQFIALPVLDDIRWLLANTTDSDVAVEAIDAAIRHDMVTEVLAALTHRFAHVVARALSAVAAPLPPPLPEHLLALSKAKGSPVRKALVELLDAKPHQSHLPVLLQLVSDQWSLGSVSYGEDDDYPIAGAAVHAIAKLGPLSSETADQLYQVAIDSRDPDLRFRIFTLLAGAAGVTLQQRLFDLSVSPGRLAVRRAAASALLVVGPTVAPEVVARITPELLATRIEPVAVRLSLLVAGQGELDAVAKTAQALATNAKRRVLLVLLVWELARRDRAMAERIASLLPSNHPALDWALAGDIGEVRGDLLDDLGDPIIVAQVLLHLKPKKN